MSTQEKASGSASASREELFDLESSLGQALVLIHRFLPRTDDPARGEEVQSGLKQAVACLDAARVAHQKFLESRRPIVVGGQVRVEAEVVAVIAAAVASVLGQPYRLVAVQPVPQPAPHLNVWALEGRTQIFLSHRIR
jgi:hypothetical protein